MKTLLLLALTMAFGPLQSHGNLLDFQKMIKFKTGKNALISYAFYGCYCGWGGLGTPIDATDWCCAEHDCCYRSLEKEKCGTKFLNYNFSYQNGQIVCGKQNYCRRQVCECDKAAASCFARYLGTYQEDYIFYPKRNCREGNHQCPPLEV